MKDSELVTLWGGNLPDLFFQCSNNKWEEERWNSNWRKHRLLPSKIRISLEQEVNNENTEQKGRARVSA